jgi:hypothetical protein
MIELKLKNKEVDITIQYSQKIGGKPNISLTGEGDLSHHLIEGCFDILDRLARMESVGHQSKEWRDK